MPTQADNAATKPKLSEYERGYREGYHMGFTQAMEAVRDSVRRELRVHENMEIMRGRGPVKP